MVAAAGWCLLAACWSPPPASAAGEDAWGGLPAAGGFALAVRYGEVERATEEYDDRYNPAYDTQRGSWTRQRFLQVSYGLTPALAADLRLGTMTAGLWPRDEDPSEEFAWGVGLRALLWTHEPSGLGVGASFAYDRATETADIPTGWQYPMEWEETEEWRLDVTASRRWDRLGVFGGLLWSECWSAYTHGSAYGTREGGREVADNVGIFAGLTWRLLGGLTLAVEARLLDVTGGIAGSSAALTSLAVAYVF